MFEHMTVTFFFSQTLPFSWEWSIKHVELGKKEKKNQSTFCFSAASQFCFSLTKKKEFLTTVCSGWTLFNHQLQLVTWQAKGKRINSHDSARTHASVSDKKCCQIFPEPDTDSDRRSFPLNPVCLGSPLSVCVYIPGCTSTSASVSDYPRCRLTRLLACFLVVRSSICLQALSLYHWML